MKCLESRAHTSENYLKQAAELRTKRYVLNSEKLFEALLTNIFFIS
jgi:hypothetical protein